MKPALIIIDIQNDYFPGGKMELEGSIDASLQAARLLAKDTGGPITVPAHRWATTPTTRNAPRVSSAKGWWATDSRRSRKNGMSKVEKAR